MIFAAYMSPVEISRQSLTSPKLPLPKGPSIRYRSSKPSSLEKKSWREKRKVLLRDEGVCDLKGLGWVLKDEGMHFRCRGIERGGGGGWRGKN